MNSYLRHKPAFLCALFALSGASACGQQAATNPDDTSSSSAQTEVANCPTGWDELTFYLGKQDKPVEPDFVALGYAKRGEPLDVQTLGEKYGLKMKVCVNADATDATLLLADLTWDRGADRRPLVFTGDQFEIKKGKLIDLLFGTSPGFEYLVKYPKAPGDGRVENRYFGLVGTANASFLALGTLEDGRFQVTEAVVGNVSTERPDGGREPNPSFCDGDRPERRSFTIGSDVDVEIEYCSSRDEYSIESISVVDHSRNLPSEFRGKKFSLKRDQIFAVDENFDDEDYVPMYSAQPRSYFSVRHHFSCDAVWLSLPHASYGLTSAAFSGGAGLSCDPLVKNAPKGSTGERDNTFYEVRYPKSSGNPQEVRQSGKLPCSHYLMDRCR